MGFVLRVHLYSTSSYDWRGEGTELVVGTWMNSADKHQPFSSKLKRGKDTLALEKCWKEAPAKTIRKCRVTFLRTK
jgi:hypothetical protein